MKRPRSLGLAGLFSIVQGAGLMSLGALGAKHALSSPALITLLRQLLNADFMTDVRFVISNFGALVSAGLFPVVWLGVGIGTLVCGLGLMRLQSWAWLGSLIVEGLILAWTLFSHLTLRAHIIDYSMMASAIVIVLLLNQLDTQLAFQEQRQHLEEQMGR